MMDMVFKVPDRCPVCGDEDPLLESFEVVNAYLRIETRDREVVGFGTWSTDPDSMTTVEYRWGCCDTPLTDEEQDVLDEVLMNRRWNVTWAQKERKDEPADAKG